MFVILAYDVNQKRVSKVMKICRKYLVHVQKSVFEGILTEGKLQALKRDLKKVIDVETDGVCIYSTASTSYFLKEELGVVEDNSNII